MKLRLLLSSFQARLIAFFVGLVLIVQIGVFTLVDVANTQSARAQINTELEAGAHVFQRFLEIRRAQLVQSVRILSSDFAFREAIATNDRGTIVSVLQNHGKRIKADAALLISMQHQLTASTLEGDVSASLPQLVQLVTEAEADGRSSGVVSINQHIYQMVVLPVLAPTPIAWVCIGFEINSSFARELQSLTNLQVSFLAHDAAGVHLVASTLGPAARATLMSMAPSMGMKEGHASMLSRDDEWVSYSAPIAQNVGQTNLSVVLQRSLAAAMAPFRRTREQLIFGFLAALVISILGGYLIARNISRPVKKLAEAAERMSAGDYQTSVRIEQHGEIGQLADAFNHMQETVAEREGQILKQARTDALTGLPNRAWFMAMVNDEIARQPAHLAIVILRLGRLRELIHALGHTVGDTVLQQVAPRMQDLLPVGACLARLDGYDFVVKLPVDDAAALEAFAATVLKAFRLPFQVGDQPVEIGAWLGASWFPAHGDSAERLLQRADRAVSNSALHAGSFAVYTPELDQHTLRRLSLVGELRQGIEDDQLTVYYQPKIDAVRRVATGCEALVRWIHPVHGFLPPDEFIGLAEQTGLIRPLTRFVLNQAIRQCVAWREQGFDLHMAVNLSARMLQDSGLPEQVAAILDGHGLAPESLVLEITESALMADPDLALDIMSGLNAQGIKLSIDDFGTGYSSLAYLKKLPVSELKVDKSFVRDLERSSSDEIIVHSTIELAHNLGLSVTAEGVETGQSLEKLVALKCDRLQGYFMSRPVPADALGEWLRASEWAPLRAASA